MTIHYVDVEAVGSIPDGFDRLADFEKVGRPKRDIGAPLQPPARGSPLARDRVQGHADDKDRSDNAAVQFRLGSPCRKTVETREEN